MRAAASTPPRGYLISEDGNSAKIPGASHSASHCARHAKGLSQGHIPASPGPAALDTEARPWRRCVCTTGTPSRGETRSVGCTGPPPHSGGCFQLGEHIQTRVTGWPGKPRRAAAGKLGCSPDLQAAPWRIHAPSQQSLHGFNHSNELSRQLGAGSTTHHRFLWERWNWSCLYFFGFIEFLITTWARILANDRSLSPFWVDC